ncbi:MAG TPA: hypothetical protein PLI68_15025, partial [Bacteroidia bacterium]|nr:hypothetical protein [Bacteroidia bacterium]
MNPKILTLAFFIQVQLCVYAQQSKSDKIARDIEHNTKVVSKKAAKNVEYVAKESGKNIEKISKKTAEGVEKTVRKIDA